MRYNVITMSQFVNNMPIFLDTCGHIFYFFL